MPEYAAKGRGRNGIRGERRKCSDISKGSENSEKSGVFMLITPSKNDTPGSEADTLSGVQFLHSVEKCAEH